MTENTTETAATPDLSLSINIPHSALEGSTDDRAMTIDLASIPADARLELLRGAVRTFVTNRVNVANVRANAARKPFA